MLSSPPPSPPFPYTTLFRSETRTQHLPGLGAVLVLRAFLLAGNRDAGRNVRDAHGRVGRVDVLTTGARRTVRIDTHIRLRDVDRSEEHTSELQSRENLVCRL